jgi:hypothetical protein
MLAKCANPACSNHFLYLHQGKLFRLDLEVGRLAADPDFREQGPRVEYFWLCEHCADDMTVVLRKGQGVMVRPFRFRQQAAS